MSRKEMELWCRVMVLLARGYYKWHLNDSLFYMNTNKTFVSHHCLFGYAKD